MEQRNGSKNDVIMAGIGGMGVLVAGQVLTWTANEQFKHVSYSAVYGSARRGGLCECTVIFSNDRIASPLVDQAKAVLLYDASQFKVFEQRVRPGGLMIAEKKGLTAPRQRDDYELCLFAGLETAAKLGEGIMTNMIMLGYYLALTGSLPVDAVKAEITRRYKDNPKLLQRNLAAFDQGFALSRGGCA